MNKSRIYSGITMARIDGGEIVVAEKGSTEAQIREFYEAETNLEPHRVERVGLSTKIKGTEIYKILERRNAQIQEVPFIL